VTTVTQRPEAHEVWTYQLAVLIGTCITSLLVGVMTSLLVRAVLPWDFSFWSFLLPAFAAAFLGSTTITPGRFNPWGTFIAVYFLATGITGLAILGVQTWVQNVFYGGALVIAVSASQVVKERHERAARL